MSLNITFQEKERSVDIHSLTCLTLCFSVSLKESISLSDVTYFNLFDTFNMENFVIYLTNLTNFWCNSLFCNTAEMFWGLDNLCSSTHSVLDAYEICCPLISSSVKCRGYVMLNDVWGWLWMVKHQLSPKYLLCLFINLGWWSI